MLELLFPFDIFQYRKRFLSYFAPEKDLGHMFQNKSPHARIDFWPDNHVDSFYTVFIWLEAVRFLHKFTLIFGKIWSIEEGSAYSRDFS